MSEDEEFLKRSNSLENLPINDQNLILVKEFTYSKIRVKSIHSNIPEQA